MGVINHLDITGAKGGESKPKAPVEAPDSLQSTNIAKILLAVGEGEFDGVPTDRDIYLDNTPITDANGNVNFPGVKWEWRRGSVEQDYIQGIPAVESETSVGVELRSDAPFTRALNDPQLSAVRVRLAWPRLLRQDASGNTNGYRIEYAIDIASDGGAYVEAHRGAVEGKTSNGYQRSVRVNLPKATSGWMLRVRRLTANANTGTIADTMSVAGYTEIIDQKLRYPNTALLYVEFDAQQFQNIPAVSVRCKAKRWPVPSNYDPLTRTYDGVWDGTFKQAWTNNPALVTYGLCVEDRFGLGKRIKPWMVDKWEMYRIAQYCDQPVPDGIGGQEPRFLCDINLQGRADAWTLLRDLSAIYRGMVYWAHGALFMQADMPRAQDVDYVFTRANVIDGDFVYGGAERSSHYSRALVSYDNPANNYDTDVIPVTDLALQRRYRDRPIEISAIGCTRASEAQRRGKWALLSNHQDRTVTFKTGMEGRIPLPGYVIPVADELVAGRPNGGRIAAAAGRTITLDRDTEIQAGDRLMVNLPNGTAQARTVQAVQGREVTVTTAYDVAPEPQLQWAIDHQDLAIQLFRVLKTSRTQEGHYEITALEFNPSKFAAIDTGAKLDERPISVIPVTTVQAPANVALSSSHMVDQGIAVNTMTIAWDAVQGAVGYDVEWRKDNGNWVRLQRTGTTSVDVIGIYAGAYLARVRAVSAFDASSAWKSSALTQLNGKAGSPPAITSLTTESLLFGIGLKWTFPAGAEDTQRTELWYGEGTDLAKAAKLADLAYPQDKHTLQGLRAGQRFYFWARLVDRSGNLGPWYPVDATLVSGQASADAGPILEQIAQQIGESELGKELTSKIEKIALIDGNGPGSVNERVGSAKTELAKQIGDVNNALSGVKSTLDGQLSTVSKSVTDAKTELQQQIANVSTLAGSLPYRKDKAYSINQNALGADGKLYQATKAVPLNTPPPNVDYWTDVGQAVVTAGGTAARVSKLETDVSTLDGKTTAQASQLSGLQTSLTATNGNVTAAQTAADAANALAGGKGKVLIQAAAPAAADRLAQNLWIDTTGNANTPKRWTGSAWGAVTDKAATDAAAAAAGALALAQTKADASVVSSLTTRVTDAEGKLTAQATRLDGMQTSIDGKASSQALQQVTSRVTATEQKDAAQDQQLTSQSQALTSLKDSVDKKADSSAVQSLNNEVKQQGQTLTSQGQSLVAINSTIGQLGGENWIYNPSFEKADVGGLAAGWAADGASGTSIATTLVASTLAANEFAQRLQVTGVSASAWVRLRNPGDKQVQVTAGAPVTLSAYVKGTAGLPARCELQFLDSSNAAISGTPTAASSTLGADYQRISHSVTAPAGAVKVNYRVTVYGTALITAGFVEVDRTQLEFSASMSGWRDNGVVSVEAAAVAASAVQSLSGRVDQTESSLTSQSGAITQLTNSLNTTNQDVGKKADASTVQSLGNTVSQQGTAISANGRALTSISASLANLGASGVNLVPAEYCAFAKDLPANMYSNGGVAMSAVADAAAFKGYALKAANSNVDSHTFGLNNGFTAAGCNMGFKPGKYLVSFYARAEVAGHVVGVYARVLLADGSSFKTSNSPTFALTTTWARYVGVIDLTDPAYTGTQMQLAVQSNRSGVANRVTYYDRFMFEAAVNDQVEPSTFSMGNSFDQSAVLAEATTALSGRVGKTEEGLTSTSSQLTQLKNSIGGSGVNLVPADYSQFRDPLPVIGRSANVSVALVNSPASPTGKALRVVSDAVASRVLQFSAGYTELKLSLKADTAYIVSGWLSSGAAIGKIQWFLWYYNESNAVTYLFGPDQDIKSSAQRVSAAITAPVEGLYGVGVRVNRAAIEGAAVVIDRVMVEQQVGSSTAPSTYVPGVTADQASAAASAIESLNSAVTQQGKDLTAVTSRTTLLEGSVNSTSSGLATKASTSALQTLTGRVTATENGLTAANSSIIRIGSQVGAIGGTGSNLIPAEYSTFTDSPPSLHKAATLTLSSERDTSAYSGYLLKADSTSGVAWLYLSGSAGDYTLRLTPGRQYIFSAWAKGSAAHSVGVRLRYQNSAGAAVEVGLSSMDVGTSLGRVSAVITIPSAVVGPASIVLYTQAGSAAGTTWFDGFMLEEKVGESNAPSAFTPGTSTRQAAGQAAALSSLDTKVTQQGAKIESEAKRTDGLYTSVGNTSAAVQSEASTRSSADAALTRRTDGLQSNLNDATAAIQNEARTRADADGALSQQIQKTQASLGNTNASVQQVTTAQADMKGMLNAQYTMRVQINNQIGVHHWGGFGIGINEQNGVVQSAFVVYSDQFVLLNANGGGLSSPFSVVGGQTFISDAYIRNASIGTAKIANGAIANAQIQDAAITNSKIGDLQVDTLKIGNEAVTIPRYAGYAPRFNCNATWQTPLTITFYMPQPGMVYINYSSTFLSHGTQYYQYRLVLDGNLIAESVARWSDSSITLASGQYVGAGQHTVDFSILAEVGVVLSYQNLMVQGIMK